MSEDSTQQIAAEAPPQACPEPVERATTAAAPPPARTPAQVLRREERRFEVAGREIVVRPLVWGEWEEMGDALGVLLQHVVTEHPEIDVQHFDRHVQVLVPMLLQLGRGVVAQMLGLEEEFLRQSIIPAEAFELVVAALEVNQLPGIAKNWSRARDLVEAMKPYLLPTRQ